MGSLGSRIWDLLSHTAGAIGEVGGDCQLRSVYATRCKVQPRGGDEQDFMN